jgi:cytochrome c-type biogenesis protein CcmH
MSPWLLMAIMVVAFAAAGALAWPAIRRPPPPPRSSAHQLEVYRDQLAELARDEARGLIGSAEAAAARLEIERRILRVAEEPAAPVEAPGGRAIAAVLAVAVPLLATGVYLVVGSPTLPDRPLAARSTDPGGGDRPDIGAMVARLEQRLQAHPDDVDGWLMLGRSRSVLDEHGLAAIAFRKALELRPDDPEALGGLAESLIAQAGGLVGAEPRQLLERLDGRVPGDPRAGYYLGLAAAQAGDRAAAAEYWRRLLAGAPRDVPWREPVVAAIREAGASLGIDVASVLDGEPGAAADPRAAEAARIAALPPEQQQARIREMVDGLAARLEADGGTVEEWSRLAQARLVLGDRAAAAAAWDRALAEKPDDAGALKGKARALLGDATQPSGLPLVPDEAAALLERAAALGADDPEVDWLLGIHALQQGAPTEARERWQRVLARLDPADPGRAAVQSQLDRLTP